MKEIDYIVGIYHYLNPNPEENSESAYYLLYLLDDKGMLERDLAAKLYMDNFKDESLSAAKTMNKAIGPFSSIEKLNQFAFLLCEEMDASKVSLLSVDEYNSILENTHQAADFHRYLVEKGNVMENIERKKKGIFRRFFS